MSEASAKIAADLATSAATMILTAKPGSVVTIVVSEPGGALLLRSSHKHREALAGLNEGVGMLHEAIGKMEGRLHDLHRTVQ